MAAPRWRSWQLNFHLDIISRFAVKMSSHASPTGIVPSQLEAGVEKSDDSMVVDWDGPDDCENPRNWSSYQRQAHVVIISILALITYVTVFILCFAYSLCFCTLVPILYH